MKLNQVEIRLKEMLGAESVTKCTNTRANVYKLSATNYDYVYILNSKKGGYALYESVLKELAGKNYAFIFSRGEELYIKDSDEIASLVAGEKLNSRGFYSITL